MFAALKMRRNDSESNNYLKEWKYLASVMDSDGLFAPISQKISGKVS